jgi:hypothetical protein
VINPSLIRILAMGKVRKGWVREGVALYLKRLPGLVITELKATVSWSFSLSPLPSPMSWLSCCCLSSSIAPARFFWAGRTTALALEWGGAYATR